MFENKANRWKQMDRSKVKCAVVGDSQVGKTALCKMYSTQGNQFPKSYQMTIGVDLVHSASYIKEADIHCHLFLYDSSGKDLYHKIIQKYWHEPNIILVVIDLTSRATLQSTFEWVKYVRSCMSPELASTAPGIIFGNKNDLTELREISQEEAESLAEKLSLQYMEGSVKNYSGVEEMFQSLLKSWYDMNF